ncbi:MAG: hypothetical protein Q4Q62_05270 [Thermoplasmata archaeon]|nr:hypothetical protein [Thermoplasmata archaeon]
MRKEAGKRGRMLAALAVLAVAAVALTAVAAVPEAQAAETIDVSNESGLSNMTDGNTYRLSGPVTIHSTITVTSGISVTLDLNGHTLSVAGGSIIVQGSLTITDSGSGGTLIYNGTTYSALIFVESEGSLKVEGGTITSSSSSVIPIRITGGTVTIEGGDSVAHRSELERDLYDFWRIQHVR